MPEADEPKRGGETSRKPTGTSDPTPEELKEMRERMLTGIRRSRWRLVAPLAGMGLTLLLGLGLGRAIWNNSDNQPPPPPPPGRLVDGQGDPEDQKAFDELKRRLAGAEDAAKNAQWREDIEASKFQKLSRYNQFRVEVEDSFQARKDLAKDLQDLIPALEKFDKEYPVPNDEAGRRKNPTHIAKVSNYAKEVRGNLKDFEKKDKRSCELLSEMAEQDFNRIADIVHRATTEDDKKWEEYTPTIKKLQKLADTASTMKRMAQWGAHPILDERIPEHIQRNELDRINGNFIEAREDKKGR